MATKKNRLRLSEWAISRRAKKETSLGLSHGRTGVIITSTLKDPHSEWCDQNLIVRNASVIREEEWLAEQSRYALQLLRQCVERDPGKHSGVAVLRGTRFTIAQLFAEMSEGRGILEIAEAYRLDKEQLRELLEGLSMHFDQPLVI